MFQKIVCVRERERGGGNGVGVCPQYCSIANVGLSPPDEIRDRNEQGPAFLCIRDKGETLACVSARARV